MKTKLFFLVLIAAAVIGVKVLCNAHTQIKSNASALAEIVDAS